MDGVSLPPDYTLRPATHADAETVQAQRDALFVEIGRAEGSVEALSAQGLIWLRSALSRGYDSGWLIVKGDQPVAGAGLIWNDMPPNPDTALGVWAYLLNVYVDPLHRQQGLAGQLIGMAHQTARERGINLLYIHTSEAGRPLYERRGYWDNGGMEYHLLPGAES